MAADLSERQQRVRLTAIARNRLLLWLGYRERVPECELDGEAAPKARRAYLAGVPCGFTRSDRSMAVWDDKRGAWRLAVDDWWQPSLYDTKEAALAAGRRAEKPRKVVPTPAVLVASRAWARKRDEDHAMHTLCERVAGGEVR